MKFTTRRIRLTGQHSRSGARGTLMRMDEQDPHRRFIPAARCPYSLKLLSVEYRWFISATKQLLYRGLHELRHCRAMGVSGG